MVIYITRDLFPIRRHAIVMVSIRHLDCENSQPD